MADTYQGFERLARELETRELRGNAAEALPVDICETWKIVQPFVDTGVKLLRMLPFGWARKLADALELLAKAMNAFCSK